MRYHPVLLGCVLVALAGCGGPPKPTPPWLLPAEKPREENFHGGNASLLLKYDADHDGILTRDELIRGLKAEFAAHDTHHNGCLDAEQVADINQDRVDTDQAAATPVVDWNQDGCVDYTEFSAAPYSLFDQLDVDHDGKLSSKELERAGAKKPDAPDQPPAEPAQGGGHHRRGGGGTPPPQ